MTWYAKNTGAYLMGSVEADSNAREMLNLLMNSYGWTFEACCGLFGNIDFEGGWNPWRWENDNILTYMQSQTTTKGMGLIGWTPARKYLFNNAGTGSTIYFPNYNQESYPGYAPNWSDRAGSVSDGNAQTMLIGEAMARNSNNMWVQRKACTAHQFISLSDPRQAAYYWLWNAEYPADIQNQESRRMSHALAWYEHLGGSGGKGFPLPILFKRAIDYAQGIL